MAILIDDCEADRLIRTLGEQTGESITEEIVERGRKLPIVDDRTTDEIIGYNAREHFD
jgi:hypothetical protein